MHLDILLQDFRYTLRTLARDRSFTLVAILILALGIGANIAVFSVVNTLLLRPLPFANPQQLVWIAPPPTKCGVSCATYSTDAYDEFRAHAQTFQDVTGYYAFSGTDNLSLNLGGTPIPATSIDVIANFFQLLGVQPAMGRAFTADDARDGAAPVVLLTDAWWRHQFNADPAIVGKAFDMNGQQTTVIGVLPSQLRFWRGLLAWRERSTPSLRSISTVRPATGETSSRMHRPAQARRDFGAGAGRRQGCCALHVLEQQVPKYMRLLRRQREKAGQRASGSAEGLHQRKAEPLAGGSVVSRGHDSAHRLRKSFQPDAGARRRAQQGVRDALAH